ncbi:hypothetical protein CSC02_4795 [Enterobacter hormaechei subsp. hoffmannii]|nr:hypothetical protein CSC02_4795 [Enterobacter hormaechei subsp. hoffmannii]
MRELLSNQAYIVAKTAAKGCYEVVVPRYQGADIAKMSMV